MTAQRKLKSGHLQQHVSSNARKVHQVCSSVCRADRTAAAIEPRPQQQQPAQAAALPAAHMPAQPAQQQAQGAAAMPALQAVTPPLASLEAQPNPGVRVSRHGSALGVCLLIAARGSVPAGGA